MKTVFFRLKKLLYVKKPSIQVELRQFHDVFSFDTHSTPTNLSLLPILKLFDFFSKEKHFFFSQENRIFFKKPQISYVFDNFYCFSCIPWQISYNVVLKMFQIQNRTFRSDIPIGDRYTALIK